MEKGVSGIGVGREEREVREIQVMEALDQGSE
jgi:hypothetical protein